VLIVDQELLDGIKQIVQEVVREEISGVNEDISSLKGDLSSLKEDAAEMKELLNKNNHLLRVLRIETDTNKIKLSIINDELDRFINNQKRQNALKDELKKHQHKLVIETGEPIFNNQ